MPYTPKSMLLFRQNLSLKEKWGLVPIFSIMKKNIKKEGCSRVLQIFKRAAMRKIVKPLADIYEKPNDGISLNNAVEQVGGSRRTQYRTIQKIVKGGF